MRISFRSISIFMGIMLVLSLGCTRSNPFPHIDYTTPSTYSTVPTGSGATTLIDSIAHRINATSSEKIMTSIWFWIHDNLTYVQHASPELTTFEALVRAGVYTNSATHAILFGTLCRAKGIPTIWVNTVDDAWILDYQTLGSTISYYSGYVYLECFIGGTWKLVDAYSGVIYATHDYTNLNMPKQRYAFAKAQTPSALIMENRPEQWHTTLAHHFTDFDTNLLETLPAEGDDFLLQAFKGRRPSIGVKIQNTHTHEGVLVIQTAPNYPGARAGIEPGDIIMAVDATTITDIFQLVDIIIHKGFDATFSITIMRAHTQKILLVTIPAST